MTEKGDNIPHNQREQESQSLDAIARYHVMCNEASLSGDCMEMASINLSDKSRERCIDIAVFHVTRV